MKICFMTKKVLFGDLWLILSASLSECNSLSLSSRLIFFFKLTFGESKIVWSLSREYFPKDKTPFGIILFLSSSVFYCFYSVDVHINPISLQLPPRKLLCFFVVGSCKVWFRYNPCNNARLDFSTIFVPSFDPNEWCLKMASIVGVRTQDLSVFCLNH